MKFGNYLSSKNGIGALATDIASLEKKVVPRLNVLALSYLFPNTAQPAYGIFVLNRLKAIHKYCDVNVIAPIQWYPFIHHVRGAMRGPGVLRSTEIEGLAVFHPRFVVIPRFMKWIDAITFWISARSVVKKQSMLQTFKYDLVDVHWTYPDIVAGYLLAKRRNKKFIVTIRGHEALYDNESSLRRWLVAYFLRKADFVITLSDELRDKVIGLGIAAEKSKTVLNGVDIQHFRPLNRDECRRQVGVPIDSKVMVSVGRVTEGKGHQDLVRIMPSLNKCGSVELYIIGGVNPEDDFTHTLHKMIADLNLKNVHLVDSVSHDQLPLWYSAADLFCLASKREGCPNVVLEALACGTPVVVTNVGSVSELIVPGENGALVELAQLDSLGQVVSSALEKSWDRTRIAARMANWGWDACAVRVVEIYESLLGKDRKGLVQQ